MRNFDLWNRYLDNQGNPLHGCVQFMVKDGNTIAPIFDSDGTALDNPQLTDIYGRTQHQVFINEDVVAYFYAYIGNGTWTTELDIDTSDQTKWTLQYTIESQNTLSMNITTDSLICIPTINALRNLDINSVPSLDTVKSITLLGYNALGDKEPINYYWNPESTETDNGGSIIKSSNLLTGRWIMVQPTEHCDSRHFGVFPSNSRNMSDQTYGIIKLFEYCQDNGIKPFFNGDGDYVWFRYGNINVTANKIDISKGVKFRDEGKNTITGEWSNDPLFEGKTNVVAKNVKLSWNAKTYSGYENVVIDEIDLNNRNWQNAHINATVNPCYGQNFNNCTFEENGTFGSNNGSGYNTFNNCTLTSKMFILDGDNETTFATGQATNCVVRQEDWLGEDAFYYYIQLRMTNIPDACFDYKGVTSKYNPLPDYTNRVITASVVRLYNYNSTRNVVLNTLDADVIEINNCTGQYSFSAFANKSIIIKNCKDFVITYLPANCVLMVEDSTVTLDSSATVGAVSFKNSNVTAANNNITLTCSTLTAFDSIVTVQTYCYSCVVKDSQVNKQLTITFDDTINCSMFIDNNIFNDYVVIRGAANGLGNLVKGAFTNNFSNVVNPITLVRDNLNGTESNHAYTYSNNKGTFLPSIKEGVCFDKNITFVGVGTLPVDYPDDSMVYAGDYTVIAYDNLWHDNNPGNENRGISGGFDFFRIGTDSFKVIVNWNVNSTTAPTIPWFELVTPLQFQMNCVYDNGWRLNTTNVLPGGRETLRVTYNRTGLTVRQLEPSDVAGNMINCTFLIIEHTRS